VVVNGVPTTLDGSGGLPGKFTITHTDVVFTYDTLMTVTIDTSTYWYMESSRKTTTLGGKTLTQMQIFTICGQESIALAAEGDIDYTYVKGSVQSIPNANNFAEALFKVTPFIDPSNANAYTDCNTLNINLYLDAAMTTPFSNVGDGILSPKNDGSIVINTAVGLQTSYYFKGFTKGNKFAIKILNLAICGDETIRPTGKVIINLWMG
jgi:hypothetical protein